MSIILRTPQPTEEMVEFASATMNEYQNDRPATIKKFKTKFGTTVTMAMAAYITVKIRKSHDD